MDKCCQEVESIATCFMERNITATESDKKLYIESTVSLHAASHYISKHCFEQFEKDPDYLRIKHYGDFWKVYLK